MGTVLEDHIIRVGELNKSNARMSISSPYLHKIQKRHFILYNLLRPQSASLSQRFAD